MNKIRGGCWGRGGKKWYQQKRENQNTGKEILEEERLDASKVGIAGGKHVKGKKEDRKRWEGRKKGIERRID